MHGILPGGPPNIAAQGQSEGSGFQQTKNNEPHYPKHYAGGVLIGVEWTDRQASSGPQLFCCLMFWLFVGMQLVLGICIV